MAGLDFKKELKHLYKASAHDFELVEVPEMAFLMIEGQGDPGRAQEYQDAVEALYSVAYPLKFASKKQLGKDYVVPPLEGLWWADDMAVFTTAADRDAWKWTMMIMTPDWISPALFAGTAAEVQKKKDLPALSRLRLERFHEGPSLQILHTGPYAAEGPTLHRLHHQVMPARQVEFAGKHHEIYLSDPRRVAPEKLKTILRQPVRRSGEIRE